MCDGTRSKGSLESLGERCCQEARRDNSELVLICSFRLCVMNKPHSLDRRTIQPKWRGTM